MNEHEKHIDYYLLTSKYLAGETNEAETRKLEAWVKKDDKNKKRFREFKKAWALSHTTGLNPDAADAWNTLEKSLFENDNDVTIKRHPSQRNFLLKIAATLLVIAGVSFVIFYIIRQPGITELKTMADSLTEVLEDGTEVTLNQNSSVTYTSSFNKQERKVTLNGDAFFDVERAEEKPFIVQTDGATISVLGTSFYVNARSEKNQITVTVTSGRVLLSNDAGKIVEIDKGEIGSYNKTKNSVEKSSNTDANFLSWKTKRMEFNDTPLPKVFLTIEKTYHIPVEFAENTFDKCRLTSTFNQLEITKVFQIIREIYPSIKFTKSGKGYIVDGEPCE